MAKGLERHFANEEERKEAEELDELHREACREDASMFLRHMVQCDLENQGCLNPAAGEYVAEIAVIDENLCARVAKSDDKP